MSRIGHGLRRSAPAASAAWTPASLGGLVAWYDASDAATITSSAGLVSQWNDKSGNARHVTSSGGDRPTTASRTQNGLNVIDFTGSDWMTVGGVTLSQPYSVCWVGRYDAGVSGVTVAISLRELGAYAPYIAVNEWRMFNGTILLTASPTPDTSTHVFFGAANGGSSVLRIDGGTTASATGNAGTANGERINLGAANSAGVAPFDGFICEVVISTGALTGTDLSSLENYMKTKWGTP